MSGRQVLVDALNQFEQHPSGHWTLTGDAGEVVAALQAALTAPVGSMENPIDLPPTIPDNALSGMASIPDKPEPEQEGGLHRILDDCDGCQSIVLRRADMRDDWEASFEHDRVHYVGQGESPEAALVEALVDKAIGDYYYGASMDGPSLTLAEMTVRLHDAYFMYLGTVPGHGYRGSYLSDDSHKVPQAD